MTDFFVGLIELLKSWVLKLPELGVDSSSLSSIFSSKDTIIQFIAAVNFLLPLPTILTVLAIVYGFKAVKFSIFIINWVIRRLADFFP